MSRWRISDMRATAERLCPSGVGLALTPENQIGLYLHVLLRVAEAAEKVAAWDYSGDVEREPYVALQEALESLDFSENR